MQQIKIVETLGNNHIDFAGTNHFHPRFLARFGPGWHNCSRYSTGQFTRQFTTLGKMCLVIYVFKAFSAHCETNPNALTGHGPRPNICKKQNCRFLHAADIHTLFRFDTFRDQRCPDRSMLRKIRPFWSRKSVLWS